jgi:hypothetical protein
MLFLVPQVTPAHGVVVLQGVYPNPDEGHQLVRAALLVLFIVL